MLSLNPTSTIPGMGALLALDVGDRRIGLALTDADRRVVMPHSVVHRSESGSELAWIQNLVEQHQVCALIVGLPLLASGVEGEQAHKTRWYADRLARQLGLPLAYWDERNSSTLAGRLLVDSGRLGKRNRQRLLDALAAQQMLEDFLAALGSHVG